MLDTICQLAKIHPNLKFHLAAPREKIANMCQKKIETYRTQHPDCPEISISTGDTGVWMQTAGTGLAASGTVTVECALSGLPLVVGYKLNLMTLALAKILVKLYRGFFTMVNIIANKEVFQEFLQWHFAPEELLPAIEAILPGGSRRAEVEAGMKEVSDALRNPNNTSVACRVAKECWE